ncbi:1-acyl-sn-glycerol-3-phosphate acyltransferase [Comamonas sp. BIGb0124]|uniref:lysophospholipid acyltransferase family protein n=1 Tax=Comamonas sp. BIGb0124 TaxID=2485130 RepID=UPI000F48F283|nr:lysophospholipid acyltransferase family protein [Comamonas sp. BIGb0124]ROR22520.1 1-acyl-sn-glycerol-3-phosphate acyltransferase [Comamonas sp. BIGb0124]
MPFIRSVLHMLWLIVTVIPWALIVMVASIFTRGERLYRLTIVWNAMVRWGSEVILGIQTRVTGLENLPSGGEPVILLAKHQSAYETIVMPLLVSRPVAFVFKRELLRIPFFGWALGRLDMVHIDRQQGAQAFNKVAKQGRRLLDQGVIVLMFPEGTRIKRGEKGKYKSGGARLAIQTGTPVYPVAITSGRCWPARGFVKYPGVVEFSFGPAIPSVGRQPDELVREVEQWVEAEMHRLDAEAYR